MASDREIGPGDNPHKVIVGFHWSRVRDRIDGRRQRRRLAANRFRPRLSCIGLLKKRIQQGIRCQHGIRIRTTQVPDACRCQRHRCGSPKRTHANHTHHGGSQSLLRQFRVQPRLVEKIELVFEFLRRRGDVSPLIFQQTLGGKQFQGRREVLGSEGVGHQMLNLLGGPCAIQQGHNLVQKFAKGMSLELDAAPLRSNHQRFVAASIGGLKPKKVVARQFGPQQFGSSHDCSVRSVFAPGAA